MAGKMEWGTQLVYKKRHPLLSAFSQKYFNPRSPHRERNTL